MNKARLAEAGRGSYPIGTVRPKGLDTRRLPVVRLGANPRTHYVRSDARTSLSDVIGRWQMSLNTARTPVTLNRCFATVGSPEYVA
jgi:hypothetical protein